MRNQIVCWFFNCLPTHLKCERGIPWCTSADAYSWLLINLLFICNTFKHLLFFICNKFINLASSAVNSTIPLWATMNWKWLLLSSWSPAYIWETGTHHCDIACHSTTAHFASERCKRNHLIPGYLPASGKWE